MKAVNLLLNGNYLIKGTSNTSIFLHNIDNLHLIHLIEMSANTFKRRIEFKKYLNSQIKYLSFSILNNNIVSSGNLMLTNNELLTATLEFKILQPNSTHILEIYKLEIIKNSYSLFHINPKNFQINLIQIGETNTLSYETIDYFLSEIINFLNSTYKTSIIKNTNIKDLFNEEQNILNTLKISSNPKLKEFFHTYNGYSRTLTK